MALKPMNCPAHVLIFRQGIKSYRDLPLRLAENGCCHRNEPHGALHGLMRVRQFTQDDAHIFCREDQIVDEVARVLRAGRPHLQATSASPTRSSWRCAPTSASAPTRCGTRPRPSCATRWSTAGLATRRIRLGGTARRRRVLCAQARMAPDRRDRPDLAGRHDPVRPRAARAARRAATSARMARSTAR